MQRKITVNVNPTPDELAFEFSIMDDEQQAIFFNELARTTEEWERPFCLQLQSLVDNPAITTSGLAIMVLIGSYGK